MLGRYEEIGGRGSAAAMVTDVSDADSGHEALVALMAQELEGSGVTANVLVAGGPTNTEELGVLAAGGRE